VPKSVLDAIRLGVWDFEPPDVPDTLYPASDAMPGTHEKVALLAQRLHDGLPLWHPADRDDAEADALAGGQSRPV